jgi:hypothetical protein
MTSSGVTAWSLTARELVTTAVEDARIYSSGEDVTADDMDVCIRRLNGMLKSWEGKANLFREAEASVAITGGDGIVTLPAGVRDVSSVRHIISSTNERQLAQWNRGQYMMLPNKVAVGNPSIYYLSRQGAAADLYIWPVPAASITLKIDYSRIAETVTDPGQTLDIPEEWHECVYTNLAVRIADLFGAQLSPLYLQRAEMLYQQLLDSDRPDSYTFEAAEHCQYG